MIRLKERKTATDMNAYELQFYNAGIKDANEARHITLACRSKRYEALAKTLSVKIGDKRGNAAEAYNAGVAHEINRQTMLGF